jgi:hypothetical protein
VECSASIIEKRPDDGIFRYYALGFDDACQLLRSVLDRRDQRLRDDAEQHSTVRVGAMATNGFRQSPLNLVASNVANADFAEANFIENFIEAETS